MGWVDNIPRAGNLYIGGLHALYQKRDKFDEAGITHILSILDFNIYEAGAFKEFKHHHIRIDDHPNENLLEHFEDTTRFIDDGLETGGAVFVHCAMGKSRSAACCCAYLMKKYGKMPQEALAQVCEGRPVCQPNPGFMEQLEIWGRMCKAENATESRRIYDEWLRDRYTGSPWSWERRNNKL